MIAMPPSLPNHVSQALDILQVLDNRTRLRALGVLYNSDSPQSFRDLEKRVGVSGPRLSQHLKRLVQSALVVNQYQRSQSREYSFYTISPMGRDWLKRLELVDARRGRAWLVPLS